MLLFVVWRVLQVLFHHRQSGEEAGVPSIFLLHPEERIKTRAMAKSATNVAF